MASVSTYKELLIWQKGMELAESVYAITKSFPQEEMYSLTSQLRRSAISVPSNISEGYGRKSTVSFAHFVKIARGSLYEMETQLLLANRINYIKDNDLLEAIMQMIAEEGKLINVFLQRLEEKV